MEVGCGVVIIGDFPVGCGMWRGGGGWAGNTILPTNVGDLCFGCIFGSVNAWYTCV